MTIIIITEIQKSDFFNAEKNTKNTKMALLVVIVVVVIVAPIIVVGGYEANGIEGR